MFERGEEPRLFALHIGRDVRRGGRPVHRGQARNDALETAAHGRLRPHACDQWNGIAERRRNRLIREAFRRGGVPEQDPATLALGYERELFDEARFPDPRLAAQEQGTANAAHGAMPQGERAFEFLGPADEGGREAANLPLPGVGLRRRLARRAVGIAARNRKAQSFGFRHEPDAQFLAVQLRVAFGFMKGAGPIAAFVSHGDQRADDVFAKWVFRKNPARVADRPFVIVDAAGRRE